MRPHYQIPIADCGEPLQAIPSDRFYLVMPPPYQALGADYGSRSPYYLRKSVGVALLSAQATLQQKYPDQCLLIFDAFRPVPVQEFMVNHTFKELRQQRGLDTVAPTAADEQGLWDAVYKIWAPPSLDPATPPPHSTGAAVDLTLCDRTGNALDMGGEIDELSDRSLPDYYQNRGAEFEVFQSRRDALNEAMASAGFRRHPGEWWHFSLGDQLWAWLTRQADPTSEAIARYGRVFN